MARPADGSLDTNALLRYIVGDILDQAQAVEALLTRSTRIVVADLAIIECIFVLQRYYGMTRPYVVTAIQTIMQLEVVSCSQPLFDAALKLYIAHPQLSPEDCVLAAQAQADSATPLYTFDKQLAKATDYVELIR